MPESSRARHATKPSRGTSSRTTMLSRVALLLVSAMTLSGCTFFGGENTEPSADKSEYKGGPGFALILANNGTDPMDVTVRILGVGNKEIASINQTLMPGARVEKWWSPPDRTAYSARLSYTWQGAGGSSHGFDDQAFDLNDCPAVTRLGWELQQSSDAVGSRFLGKTCIAGEA